jgi:hypothetical protein
MEQTFWRPEIRDASLHRDASTYCKATRCIQYLNYVAKKRKTIPQTTTILFAFMIALITLFNWSSVSGEGNKNDGD